MTESAEDVLSVLDGALRMPLSERKIPGIVGVPADFPDYGEIYSARAAIVKNLSPTPVMVDEIIRSGHFSLAVVSVGMVRLALAGRL